MGIIRDRRSGIGDRGSRKRDGSQIVTQSPNHPIPDPRSRSGCAAPSLIPLALFLFFLAACTSTRPVVKIGLLAPFEGLYRATGYEALAAMRAAITETETGNVAVLPLALDTSADPAQTERAMQKLRQDPSLVAIVGPILSTKMTDDSGAALAAPEQIAWLPHPAQPPSDQFLAAVARHTDAARLALASDADAWLHQQIPAWQQTVDSPMRVVVAPAQVQADEVVVWLGSPAGGARFLADLRRVHAQVPLWTTIAAGDPVFYQRAVAALDGDPQALGSVFWIARLDADFQEWSQHRTPNSPLAYAVYRATQQAMAPYAPDPPLSPPRLHLFQLMPDGASQLVGIDL